MLAVGLRPEETRRPLQDLVRPTQLTNLLLQLTHPPRFRGARPGDMAVINVSRLNPHPGGLEPDDVVLHLGDLALGPIDQRVALTAQLNGTRLLVPGNHDRVSPATQSNRAVERFRPIYEKAGWTVLPEILHGARHGVRILASHYPYAGDTIGAERHSSHRPTDTGTPLLHGHTHERAFGPHGSHEFHVGVDAFEFAPIQFELIDAWLEDLRREEEEEEIAAIVRERTAAGEGEPLDELARKYGIELGEEASDRPQTGPATV